VAARAPQHHSPSQFTFSTDNLGSLGLLAMNSVAVFVLVALPSASSALLTIVLAIAPMLTIFVFFRYWMFRVTNFYLLQNQQPSLLNLLTSESKASLYQHWLLLNRLKRKRLIDSDKMQPFEIDFPPKTLARTKRLQPI